MSNENNKKKKWLIIILSSVLVVLIGAGATIWALLGGKDGDEKKKKPSFNIINEEELPEDEEIPDDILADVDLVTDLTDNVDNPGGKVGFVDEVTFATYKTDYVLALNNKNSVNSSFMGFGAIYYPWLYWYDGAGRNYTDEQRKIELDRLVESGTKWIRCIIYARPEWYNSTKNEWEYEGTYYDGLVKFFKEIDKRGVEVMLNFEWGGSIQSGKLVFNDSTLQKAGNLDKRIKMYGNFCSSFTNAIKNEGVNCVKYITFFSEPSNSKALGGQYDTEQFESVHIKEILPLYTNLVKSAHESFKAAGIRGDYKFVGNNQSSYFYINALTWQQLKPLYEAVKEYLDEYSYHYYYRTPSPKGATYDDFAFIADSYTTDVEREMGVKANESWIDEFNILCTATEGPFYSDIRNYGGIYALRNEPYAATQMANAMMAFLNKGYKTAGVWTFTNNLWPNSTQSAGEFKNGVMLDGLMPNLMDSQVPYNVYYTYSMLARYTANAKEIYAGSNEEANGMATSCVYDKDGNITVFVVNSNLRDVEYKVNFETSLNSKIFYRHLYNPQTFEANTAAKQIGVDRVLINVTDGFIDKIPAGAVAVYTTSKK